MKHPSNNSVKVFYLIMLSQGISNLLLLSSLSLLVDLKVLLCICYGFWFEFCMWFLCVSLHLYAFLMLLFFTLFPVCFFVILQFVFFLFILLYCILCYSLDVYFKANQKGCRSRREGMWKETDRNRRRRKCIQNTLYVKR